MNRNNKSKNVDVSESNINDLNITAQEMNRAHKATKLKKKILLSSLAVLFGGAMVVVPIAVYNSSFKMLEITINSEAVGAPTQPVKIRIGSTVKQLKEQLNVIEGYYVAGVYLDSACTNLLKDNQKITENTEVFIKYEKLFYFLDFKESEYYEVSYDENVNINHIEWGESFSFSVDVKEFAVYDDLKVMVNGEELTADASGNYHYNSEFINHNLDLKIRGIKENKYKLYNIPSQVTIKRDGTQLGNNDIVTKGEELTLGYKESTNHYMSEFVYNNNRIEDGYEINVNSPINIKYEEVRDCGLIFSDIEGGLAVSGSESTDGEIVVPGYYYNQPVLQIVDSAFYTNINITKATIGENIVSIGANAFDTCCNLQEVKLPSSLQELKSGAFFSCYSLTVVQVEDSQQNPSQLEIIGSNVFDCCHRLISINLPHSITEIGESAFNQCENLKIIILPENITTISDNLFNKCTMLEEIVIPQNVTTIGSGSFKECINMHYFETSPVLQEVGADAFTMCMSLVSIKFNSETIFQILAEKTEEYNNVVPMINYAQNIFVDENIVEKYGRGLFGEETCFMKEVNNGAVEFIRKPNYQTTTNEITTDQYGCKYEKNGDNAYYRLICAPIDITEVVVNSNTKEIAPRAFMNATMLTNITLPEGLIKIDAYAFKNCKSLTSITIPNSVTTINGAFSDCSSLGSITLSNSLTKITQNTFKNCINLTSISIPDNVTSIGNSAFMGCSSLETVNISENSKITKIDAQAFGLCENLTAINLPNGLTSMGDRAFAYCFKLESITLPETINTFGQRVFSDCYGLTSVDIPEGVKTISRSLFYKCINLTSVTLPSSIEVIDNYAFYQCSSLEEISIPGKVTTINQSAFYNCKNLKQVNFLKDNTTQQHALTSINKYTFAYCPSLELLYIPSSVTYLDTQSFMGSKNFTLMVDSVYCYNNYLNVSYIYNVKQVKVLKSIVDDGANTNTYLNNAAKFTKTEDGDYYLYTIKN